MSKPFAPYPDPSLIRYTPGPKTAFSALTASTLGNAITSKDGFDQQLATVTAALKATEALHQSADQSFNDAVSALPLIDSSGVDSLAHDIGSDAGGLDNLDNALQGSVAKYATVPQLPQTPADVSLPAFNIPGGMLSQPLGSNLPITGSEVGKALGDMIKGISAFGEDVFKVVSSALAAVPIYGWILAGIGIVASLLFHGADPRQVPAAMTEQIFELAADGFHHLFMQHYFDIDTVSSLYASLIEQGVAQENILAKKYGEVRPFRDGITNMTAVINNLFDADKKASPFTAKPLTEPIAIQVWNEQSKAGWYPQSVSAAYTIYLNAVNAVIGRQ